MSYNNIKRKYLINRILYATLFSLLLINTSCRNVKALVKKGLNDFDVEGQLNPKSKTKTKTKTETSKTGTNPKTSDPSSIKKSSQNVERVISEAKKYLGTKYLAAGNDRNGIDCSGLTCASFRGIGVKIPRTANEQSTNYKQIPLYQIEKGDLVFFTDKKGNRTITHVGMVVEKNGNSVRFIHASTKRGVIVDELLIGHYKDLYLGASRVFD